MQGSALLAASKALRNAQLPPSFGDACRRKSFTHIKRERVASDGEGHVVTGACDHRELSKKI